MKRSKSKANPKVKSKIKFKVKSKVKKLKSSLKKPTSPINLSDIWPQERDYLVRPDRLLYVRKMVRSNGCVFCKIRDSGVKLESLCVYKNKQAMVVLNKYPYNSGHILILPTRHCGDLSELGEQEYYETQRLIRCVVKAIKSEYEILGLNIGLNMGSVAGAGIPEHLHWHVIPRWSGDTNFFPLIAETKVLAQTLEQVYERFSKYNFEEG